MKIVTTSTAWQSVETAADELWYVHEGAIVMDTEQTEADRLGLVLDKGASVVISAGKTVHYRLHAGLSAAVARVVL